MSPDRRIVVIDSGGANLASLDYALARQNVEAVITTDRHVIAAADRVLLPGVGSANAIMNRLRAHKLDSLIRELECPVLGICLGMQLLFEYSAEGNTAGLGLIKGQVQKISPAPDRPVPHMGWNTLDVTDHDPLLRGIGANDWFYFVHGFHAPADSTAVVATVDYGARFAAVVRQRNFCGVQFHPERSGASGAKLLANFMEL